MIDIAAVAAIAGKVNALTVIDNTFATPALQRPLEYGADLVVHSATKYLGGHRDLIAGLVTGSTKLVNQVRSRHLVAQVAAGNAENMLTSPALLGGLHERGRNGRSNRCDRITYNSGSAVRSDPAQTNDFDGKNGRALCSMLSKFCDLITQQAGRTGLNPALVDAVIKIESDYRPDAIGSAGEIGLMQMRPSTAQQAPTWSWHSQLRTFGCG